MKGYKKACSAIADKITKDMNAIENKLALKYYGKTFDKLNDDEKDIIVFDVQDYFMED